MSPQSLDADELVDGVHGFFVSIVADGDGSLSSSEAMPLLLQRHIICCRHSPRRSSDSSGVGRPYLLLSPVFFFKSKPCTSTSRPACNPSLS